MKDTHDCCYPHEKLCGLGCANGCIKQKKPQMHEHFCPVEKVVVGVAGPCNWCGWEFTPTQNAGRQ
jgi:hypothetical protein